MFRFTKISLDPFFEMGDIHATKKRFLATDTIRNPRSSPP